MMYLNDIVTTVETITTNCLTVTYDVFKYC